MRQTAVKLLRKIEENGYKAYLVGGYPRDSYLGRESLDIDICTNATPKELKTILGDVVLPMEQYGSITVIINKIRFEITTFRRDIQYINHRTPIKVEYIDDLIDDLKRRDFTINTLCMNQNEEIIDLLGAKKDLDHKIIRMVGDPKERLKEDALRILRAVRFATVLDFELEPELKLYIKKYATLLKELSYQRKKDELDKLFTSPNVAYGIELLRELELAEALELKNLDSLVLPSSLITIWAQLDVLDKYAFTNNEKELITKINLLKDKDLFDPQNLYHYGLYIASLVGELKGIERKEIVQAYDQIPIRNRKEIELTAPEISALLQRPPGPYLREIIDDLEQQIIYGKLPNDKEQLKDYIVHKYIF